MKMRFLKFLILTALSSILLGCLLPTPLHAADPLCAATLELAPGVRSDRLEWNIAGTLQGEQPNVLSELRWKKLNIRQLQVRGRLLFSHIGLPWPQTAVSLLYGYGKIIDGDNSDADYLGDDRTDRNAYMINDAGDGDVHDLSLAIGPSFQTGDGRWRFTPQVGYARQRQHLTLFDGLQLEPRRRPLPDLDSRYRAQWQGPWVGAQLAYRSGGRWSMTSDMAYHRVDYQAAADWNLRPDFRHPRSFDHRADGRGLVIGLAWRYAVTGQWSIGLQGSYQRWRAADGVDRLFLENGTVLSTRLNRVEWSSKAFNVVIGYTF